MLTYLMGAMVGLIASGIIVGGVFRRHDEWKWMSKKKSCQKCELPRDGADLLPVIGDILTAYRCRSCKAYVAWQYPVIEIFIFLLVLFHFWRYINGIWVPDGYELQVWFWLIRDIMFTLALLIVFVYDLKYSLILDKYTIPAIGIALLANLSLGYSLTSLLGGGLILSLIFAAQYALSGGRLLGAGDIRMGALIGVMLGLVGGLAAVMFAYVIGAVYAMFALIMKRHTLSDRVPFGTFLSVSTFIFMIWAPEIFGIFL